MLRNIVSAGIGLFALSILLGIVQLWFHVMTADVFSKSQLTLWSLIVLLSVTRFVLKEQSDSKDANKLD